MGLFDFLKGKKKSQSQPAIHPELQDAMDRFEREIYAVAPRYLSMPGAEIDLTAYHKDTGDKIPPAIGFPEQFEPWLGVQSLADRRGIIYQLFDQQFGNQLELWQLIERFNDDRYAEKALQLATRNISPEQEANPNYWNALARTHLILTNLKEAEACCEKALALDPKSVRTRRIWADVLHCTRRQDKAHEIYHEIVAEKLPDDKQVSLSLQELLGFDGDYTNSPIYAIGCLESEPTVTPELWDWANNEFYYSPYFRSQHAYHLIRQKEHLRGLAKLIALTDEMPWYREAVENAYNMIEQMGMTAEMAEQRNKLKTIIDSNNWQEPDPNMHTMRL